VLEPRQHWGPRMPAISRALERGDHSRVYALLLIGWHELGEPVDGAIELARAALVELMPTLLER
jgi:hypothetical protein